MKKIIALRGKSNSGKTSTFYILADLMRKSGYALKEGNFEEKFERERKRGDFWQIFEKNGRNIGLASAGDTEQQVRDNLKELDYGHHCAVILCTCRSYGNTITAIKDKEMEGFRVIWVEKPRERDESKRATADEEKAEELIAGLDIALKEQL